MIYYTTNIAEFTHKYLFCASQGYELRTEVIEACASISAQSFLDKLNDRYDLLSTPQQQHRKFLSGKSTFCCLVYTGIDYPGPFDPRADLLFFEENPSSGMLSHWFYMIVLARVNPMLLVQDGKKIEQTDRKKIDYINEELRKKIRGCDKFRNVGITHEGYLLTRKTKRAKSLKELQALSLTKNSKHATDWTWRLSDAKYKEIRDVGISLVLKYQEFLNKKVRGESEKAAYWEKHFRSLEGFLGYRGVRSQIGKLWNEEATLFRNKYKENFLSAFSGARKLKLTYIKASKMNIKNNSSIEDALNDYNSRHVELLKQHLVAQIRQEEKLSNETFEF